MIKDFEETGEGKQKQKQNTSLFVLLGRSSLNPNRRVRKIPTFLFATNQWGSELELWSQQTTQYGHSDMKTVCQF